MKSTVQVSQTNHFLIEQAVLGGGLFAMAMSRGSGKTTICECACFWAVLCGHREFVCLIGWTAREIVLPTIPSSKASGAIIKVAGITGRIRGMKHKRADGQTVRPTLVVLDGRGTRVERVGFAWERGKVSKL